MSRTEIKAHDKPLKSLEDQFDIVSQSKGGRHKAITDNMLLQAIGKYQTSSPTELTKKLNKAGIKVSMRTIQRRMKEIPQELIDATLQQVTEDELKPEHQSYSAFCQLPIVKEYSDNLQFIRKVSPDYHKRMLRGFFWICKTLNRTPKSLTSKESVDLMKKLVIDIQKGIFTRNLEGAQTAIRSWYLHHGIAGEYLTNRGITGERTKGRGSRADIKLSRDQRYQFIAVVKDAFNQDWYCNGYSIKFFEEPQLCQAMICCIKFLYYTGSRIDATLTVTWDKVFWNEPITVIKILDKGKHKKGRITWRKKIAGDFLEEFKAYWQSIGEPEKSRIFPFEESAIRVFFNESFKKAGIPERIWKGIPCHVWRHTACQDLRSASGGNDTQTANILGWKSKDTMIRHYGKADEKTVNLSLMMAMGLSIPPQEKKEFRF